MRLYERAVVALEKLKPDNVKATNHSHDRGATLAAARTHMQKAKLRKHECNFLS